MVNVEDKNFLLAVGDFATAWAPGTLDFYSVEPHYNQEARSL